MVRRLQVLVALLACVGAFAIATGASATASVPHSRPVAIERVVAHPATALAVTKFLLHAGITFYVFDHYIYKPFKAGDLHGFTHAFTIAKAALAALFVYHEIKVMAADVKDSKLLSFLATPITAAITKLKSLGTAIKGGNLNVIGGIQSSLGAIKQQSNAKGVVIKEIVHSI